MDNAFRRNIELIAARKMLKTTRHRAGGIRLADLDELVPFKHVALYDVLVGTCRGVSRFERNGGRGPSLRPTYALGSTFGDVFRKFIDLENE